MKKYLVFITLLFCSVYLSAQKTSLTVFCRVINGGLAKVNVNYLHLPEILPDSLKTALLVQPKKGHNIDDVLLRMSLEGWHIVTAEGKMNDAYPNSYLLSREIMISAEERALIAQRLNNL